jgi:hypothetical protein
MKLSDDTFESASGGSANSRSISRPSATWERLQVARPVRGTLPGSALPLGGPFSPVLLCVERDSNQVQAAMLGQLSSANGQGSLLSVRLATTTAGLARREVTSPMGMRHDYCTGSRRHAEHAQSAYRPEARFSGHGT